MPRTAKAVLYSHLPRRGVTHGLGGLLQPNAKVAAAVREGYLQQIGEKAIQGHKSHMWNPTPVLKKANPSKDMYHLHYTGVKIDGGAHSGR